MGRIFNKMYIVSGGVKPTDTLDCYRFQSMKMLNTIPKWGYITPLFDYALEIDSTGKKVEYGKESYDDYWTTSDSRQLKEFTCHYVAKINDVWVPLDIDPFKEDAYKWLEKHGYDEKIGEYGSGWYDKDHKPEFKKAIFNRIYRSLKLEWDFKRNRHAGIVPNAEKDELTIYTGKSSCNYDSEIGHIKVDGKKVIIELDDKIYQFENEKDQDFIDFVKLCNESRDAVLYGKNSDELTDNDMNWLDRKTVREVKAKLYNKPIEQIIEDEIKHVQERFGRLFDAYKD